MHIYAIGDLHLSGEPPAKPMEIFGEHWLGHKEKIKANWLATVTDEDTVIVCGDISWAMGLANAAEDLHWLAQLPGRKLLLRGNHDYWWSSLAKMQQMYGDAFEFIQNDCLLAGTTAICGTRGWVLPSAEGFTEDDEKIYKREAIRLEMSLQAAQKLQPERIICALHYPPLFAADERTLFTDLMEKYGVTNCVYGHIHGENHVLTFEGERDGVTYKLVSCDTQGFQLTKII
ncbi:metallophosphoesterase [Phascolarctobacterium sp.]|uniref:metallophosphoesterase n=1 Tax=Phascolarctobacterium sp. TaxID=2049039 RepID=UPI003865DE66